tara:strand:- start:326 stop:520 length:195 start_codon:yes stop_codon:yes gene_type:complete
MKKYKLTIVYNDITDEVEEIEEVISDINVMPRMLSIGSNNLLDCLTSEEYDQMTESYNGELYDA